MYVPIDQSTIPVMDSRQFAPELWEKGKVPTQPELFEIDYENMLASGIKFFGIMTNAGLYDVVHGDTYALPNATMKTTRYGMVADYAVNTTGSITLKHPWPNSTTTSWTTFMARIAKTAHASGAIGCLALQASGAGQTTAVGFGWNGGAPRASWHIQQNGTFQYLELTDAFALGEMMYLHHSGYRDDVPNDWELSSYRNGVLQNNKTQVVAFNGAPAGDWDTIKFNEPTGKATQYQVVAMWANSTADKPAAWHHEAGTNLFQILKPKTFHRVVKKSPGLWLPDRRLESPILFEPQRKPTGRMTLDPNNRIANRTMFCGLVVPGGLYDIVSGITHALPNATISRRHNQVGSGNELVATYDGVTSDILTIPKLEITGFDTPTGRGDFGYGHISSQDVLQAQTTRAFEYTNAGRATDEATVTYSWGHTVMGYAAKATQNGTFCVDPSPDEQDIWGKLQVGSAAIFNPYNDAAGLQMYSDYYRGGYASDDGFLYSDYYTYFDTLELGGGVHGTLFGKVSISMLIFWQNMSFADHKSWQADPYQILVPK